MLKSRSRPSFPTFLSRYSGLFVLALFVVITFCINQFPAFIEKYYSTGLYRYISRSSRFLLGWIPVSAGDLLYGAVIAWIIWFLVKLVKKWHRKQFTKKIWKSYGRKLLILVMVVYISFNWLWGFNYNRLGSARQMELKFERYSTASLLQLTDSLSARLLPLIKDSLVKRVFSTSTLAAEGGTAYNLAAVRFPFLGFVNTSLKPEMLYKAGNYIGFLGYFNPFTSEAQLNTTIPKMLLPSVCCHEMAHQLGYASESEANFIGYIACKQSPQAAFRYSIYFDLYSYAIIDLYNRDSSVARKRINALPEKIQVDLATMRKFFRSYKNPFSPAIDWIYDKYLKINSQPKGRQSYNEVVGWLIAYANKYGWKEI